MLISVQILSHSLWLIRIKENLVFALLVLGDVVPPVLCLATLSIALPQLSLVVLELIRQWTLGHKEEAVLRVG